jgi:hypothetical protein
MSSPEITCIPVTPDMYQHMALIDHAADDRWSPQTLAYRFKDSSITAQAAIIDGKVAGYVMYQRDDQHHQNSILKFTIDHAFADRSFEIQEKLLDVVKEDMSLQGRNHIVLYTDSADEETLSFFKRSHSEFKRLNAAGTGHVMLIYEMPDIPKRFGYRSSPLDSTSIDTSNLPPNAFSSSSFMSIPQMDGLTFSSGFSQPIPNQDFSAGNADIYGGFSFSTNNLPADETPEWAQSASEPEPSSHAPRKLSAAEYIVRSREKLTEMTGMEWETVTLGKLGKWIATNPHEAGDEEIYLRTASKIADPKTALNTLCRFLDQKAPASHAVKLSQAAPIAIPAAWIRPIHQELATPKKLAHAFSPASTQLRYKPLEEKSELGAEPSKAAHR